MGSKDNYTNNSIRLSGQEGGRGLNDPDGKVLDTSTTTMTAVGARLEEKNEGKYSATKELGR